MRVIRLPVFVVSFIIISCVPSLNAKQDDSKPRCLCVLNSTLDTALTCSLPIRSECPCTGSYYLNCCQCPSGDEDNSGIARCINKLGLVSFLLNTAVAKCNNGDESTTQAMTYKANLIIGVVVGVGGGIIIIVVIIIVFIVIRRRRQRPPSSAVKNTDEEPYVIHPYETVSRFSSVHPPASNENSKATFSESKGRTVSSGNDSDDHFYTRLSSNPAGFVNTTTDLENKTGYDNLACKTDYDDFATSPRDTSNPNGEISSVSPPPTASNSSDTMLLDNHLYEEKAIITNREDLRDITVAENDL